MLRAAGAPEGLKPGVAVGGAPSLAGGRGAAGWAGQALVRTLTTRGRRRRRRELLTAEPDGRPREIILRQALGTSPGFAGAPRLPAPHQAGSCLRELTGHVY